VSTFGRCTRPSTPWGGDPKITVDQLDAAQALIRGRQECDIGGHHARRWPIDALPGDRRCRGMTIDIDLRCYLRNLLTGAWA
jgi:hypothetical protein